MRILFKTDRYSQQRQRQKPVDVYPVLMAMEATYYRQLGHYVSWNVDDGILYDKVITTPGSVDFLSLPAPDRIWTNALDPKYQMYGNYKYHPATHMQVANGCWHGKCIFCVENKSKYQVRSLEDVCQEIHACINQGFREIFDDSGTFPVGDWLREFCKEWKYNYFVKFGCNMRIGADVDFGMMKRAGFRMVLFGVESANQSTLDRLQKGIKANEVISTFRSAAKAGLDPHGAFMFGIEGESEEEENRTVELIHFLLRKGYAKTAQASIYHVGAPGIDRGNLKRIYHAAYYPEFWYHQLRGLKDWESFLYLLKGIRKGIVND